MKIYATKDFKRAIMMNDNGDIYKACGFTNVLCCEGYGLAEDEELYETDRTDFEWSEGIKNLRVYREEADLTQSELAEASGVSLRMIQHYEQGVKDINKAQVATVKALADALNCKIENLME